MHYARVSRRLESRIPDPLLHFPFPPFFFFDLLFFALPPVAEPATLRDGDTRTDDPAEDDGAFAGDRSPSVSSSTSTPSSSSTSPSSDLPVCRSPATERGDKIAGVIGARVGEGGAGGSVGRGARAGNGTATRLLSTGAGDWGGAGESASGFEGNRVRDVGVRWASGARTAPGGPAAMRASEGGGHKSESATDIVSAGGRR